MSRQENLHTTAEPVFFVSNDTSFPLNHSSETVQDTALLPGEKAVNAEPEKPNQTKDNSKTRELLKIAFWSLLIAYLLKTFVIQAYKIPTGSMEDTLLVGDFLLVNKLIYGSQSPANIPFTEIKIPQFRLPALAEPKAGDVVVFRFPQDADIDYVKRCVATGGDVVEIKNKKIFINNRPWTLDEELPGIKYDDPEIIPRNKGYEPVYPEGAGSRDNYGPVTVPEGHIFVLGDNRDRSYDSRKWGFVPLDHVIGKAVLIYWSYVPNDETNIRWNRIGKIVE